MLIDTTTGVQTGAGEGMPYTDALAAKARARSGTAVAGRHEVAANV